jgi:AcrR family transcriptional regulator
MEKMNTDIRRKQLAQAAVALISEHGIKGLNVAKVARKVGLVPSAIYRHYPGKGALLDAVIELMRGRLQGNVRTVSEESSDSVERLHLLLVAHARVIRENKGIIRVIFSDELHHGNPKRKARVYEMLCGYLKGVAAIVEEGQRQGEIRAEIHPEAAAAMFLGMVQPAAIFWHLSDNTFDINGHVRRVWPLFKAAIQNNVNLDSQIASSLERKSGGDTNG